MNRRSFCRNRPGSDSCCGAFLALEAGDRQVAGEEAEAATKLQREKEFTDNWLSDLLDAIDTELE